jgi:hypothetical protein
MTRQRIKVVAAVLAAAAIVVPAAAAFTPPQPPPTYVWNGYRYVNRPTTMRIGRYLISNVKWASRGWGGAGGAGIIDGTPASRRDLVTLDRPLVCHAGPNSGRIVRAYYTRATLDPMPPYVIHKITVRLRVPACF